MRISLTGRIRVEAGGRIADEAHLGGRRGRLALVLLASRRGVGVPREELAEAFWPDGLPKAWESSLRGAVSKVRSFMAAAGLDDDDTVTSAFGCYQLNMPSDTEVDVEAAARDVDAAENELAAGEFSASAELARAAIAVASAPLLPGEDGDWIERRRDELRVILVRGLETLSRCRSRTGDAAGAVAAAEESLFHEPFRESAYRALMSAHVAAGNHGEALRVYERCCRLLAEELGAYPSPETSALQLEILKSQGPSVTDTRAASLRALPPALDVRSTFAFVGRDEELASFADAWRSSKGGDARLVLLHGEGGIGKTRMCAEVARLALDDGGVVLYGRADPDLTIPYKPFIEALDAYVDACPPESLLARLGPHSSELVPLRGYASEFRISPNRNEPGRRPSGTSCSKASWAGYEHAPDPRRSSS